MLSATCSCFGPGVIGDPENADRPCENVECSNHGTCRVAYDGVWWCVCESLYSGELCETCVAGYVLSEGNCQDIDECAVNNGGCGDPAFWSCTNIEGAEPTCTEIVDCTTGNGGCMQNCDDSGGSIVCSCDSGYTLHVDGLLCDDINECATLNGGCGGSLFWICTNNPGAEPTCTDINECSNDNGGCGDARYWACTNNQGAPPVCTDIDECDDGSNGGCGSATYWTCTNNPGANPTCTDIDECATLNGGCGSSIRWTCANNQDVAPTCTDIDECATNNGDCGSATHWTCTNNPGAAPTCVDVDECATNNGDCGNATYWTCINNLGAASTCVDIDECATNNGGCGDPTLWACTNHEGADPTCTEIVDCNSGNGGCDQFCDDSSGSIVCSCDTDYYTLSGDGMSCVDIDECDDGNNGGCGSATYWTCTNNSGANPTCTDIDECATNNGDCGNATFWTCTNNSGTNPTCTDIDECATNNGDCGSATYWICTNNPGANPTCTDIDECATNNGDCGSATYWTCTNNPGADPTCTDIDECATNNGDCGSATYWTCTNNPGAAPTCTDIDECATNNGDCGNATYWTCINNPGAAPTCVDVDECATNNGGCGDPTLWACTNHPGADPTCTEIVDCNPGNGGCDQFCDDSSGSIVCSCDTDYYTLSGDGMSCVDIDECDDGNNGGCGSATYWTCTNNSGTNPTCTDINECLTDNGGCDPLTTCTNTDGGRMCGPCPDGFSGSGETDCVDDNPLQLISEYFSSDADALAIAASELTVQLPTDKYFTERDIRWRLINALRMLGYELDGIPWGSQVGKPEIGAIDTALAAAEQIFANQAARFPFWSSITTPRFIDNLPREFGAYLYVAIFDLFNSGPTVYQTYDQDCLYAALISEMCTPFQVTSDGTGMVCKQQVPRAYPLRIDDHYIAGFTGSSATSPPAPDEFPPHGFVSIYMYVATTVHEMTHGLKGYAVGGVSWEGMTGSIDYNQTACVGTYMDFEAAGAPFTFTRYNYYSTDLSDSPSFYVSNYAFVGGRVENHAETVTAYILLPEYFRERMRFSPILREAYEFVRDNYYGGVQFHNPNLTEVTADLVSATTVYNLSRFVLHEITGHVCGNDSLDPGEQCDDGNLDEADGCDSTCQLDSCVFESFTPDLPASEGRFGCLASQTVGTILLANCPGGFLPHVVDGIDESEKIVRCTDPDGVTTSPTFIDGSCCG
ncbi:hypothetical protein ACFL6C_13240 [Myxococcota bacterium]